MNIYLKHPTGAFWRPFIAATEPKTFLFQPRHLQPRRSWNRWIYLKRQVSNCWSSLFFNWLPKTRCFGAWVTTRTSRCWAGGRSEVGKGELGCFGLGQMGANLAKGVFGVLIYLKRLGFRCLRHLEWLPFWTDHVGGWHSQEYAPHTQDAKLHVGDGGDDVDVWGSWNCSLFFCSVVVALWSLKVGNYYWQPETVLCVLVPSDAQHDSLHMSVCCTYFGSRHTKGFTDLWIQWPVWILEM